MARKAQLEEQARAELAALPAGASLAQRAAVAAKYLGPEGVMKHADVETKLQSNQLIALSRLDQQDRHKSAELTARERAGERRDDLMREAQAYKQWSTEQRLQIARGNANREDFIAGYNTGYQPNAWSPSPQQGPGAPQPAAPQGVLRASAPNDAEALRMVQVADAAGIPASVTGPVPQSAPASAVTQSAAPVMPPEIANAPRKVQDQWRLQQAKPSIAGAGQFTPQALNFTAKQYLSGDRQAVQGFARNATARIALQNEIVDEAARQGLSPAQTAAKIAEFAGTIAGSRTVGQRAANISLAATEAVEMLDIVKETSDKFGRTRFVPWNMALKAYESGTGEPEIAEFGASVNALVNVYARAINPTGVPTVSDKDHARAVLNTVQSPAQVDAVLGIIRRELEIAKKAPQQVRESIRGSVTGEATPSDRRSESRPETKRVIVNY